MGPDAKIRVKSTCYYAISVFRLIILIPKFRNLQNHLFLKGVLFFSKPIFKGAIVQYWQGLDHFRTLSNIYKVFRENSQQLKSAIFAKKLQH